MPTIQWQGDKEWNVTRIHEWKSDRAYSTLCGLDARGYINLDAPRVTCKNCLRLRKLTKILK